MRDYDEEPIDERRERRRTNWPLWLLVPLGIFGLVAVTQLDGSRDADLGGLVPENARIVFQGQTLSNAGASAVRYADNQMVQVGTSDNGIVLYRHRTQPWAGGGGGGAKGTTTNPVYMKSGDNTYLPLKVVGKAPAGGTPKANNAGGVGAER